ncbi:MAG: hypothetical protein MJ252_07855 [archaeon]|nr:hypothetical protein [archaeon]
MSFSYKFISDILLPFSISYLSITFDFVILNLLSKDSSPGKLTSKIEAEEVILLLSKIYSPLSSFKLK